jgi:hypothetical protein
MDGACATVAGVAAHHGADLAESLSQVVHQQLTRFDVVGELRSVNGHGDAHTASLPDKLSRELRERAHST